jgi:hypothetical protein
VTFAAPSVTFDDLRCTVGDLRRPSETFGGV